MPNDDTVRRDAYLDGALGLLLASLISYGELAPQEGAELRSILAAAYDEGEQRGLEHVEELRDVLTTALNPHDQDTHERLRALSERTDKTRRR